MELNKITIIDINSNEQHYFIIFTHYNKYYTVIVKI